MSSNWYQHPHGTNKMKKENSFEQVRRLTIYSMQFEFILWESKYELYLLCAESWSWNQHLIDYGDDLSVKKNKKRKMSVLQNLKRRLSVTASNKGEDENKNKEKDGPRSLFGRGYSGGERVFLLITSTAIATASTITTVTTSDINA